MEQTEIEKIYTEISQLQIELSPDPTVLGAHYINGAISKCRNHLNRISLFRLRMSQERRGVKSRLAGEETLLSAEKDRMMAEDDDVKRAPNVRDREAIANTKLRERLNRIYLLKSELLDLETVEKAVILVHEELIRTSNEIKTQRSLLLTDRYTGAGYGDEADSLRDKRARGILSADIDEQELDALISKDADLSVASVAAIVGAQPAMPVVEFETQVIDVRVPVEPEPVVEVVPVRAMSKAEEDDADMASFLSDVSFDYKPESAKAKKSVTPKKSDLDDDFLEGLLSNV